MQHQLNSTRERRGASLIQKKKHQLKKIRGNKYCQTHLRSIGEHSQLIGVILKRFPVFGELEEDFGELEEAFGELEEDFGELEEDLTARP